MQISPIGFIKAPFKEKFGVARQSLMLTEAHGILKLNDDPNLEMAITGLETFSHLWVIFEFHKNEGQEWRPLITPPRLETKDRVGVLASRSPHRPNAIGLSVLKIERIDPHAPGGSEIHLSGLDLLDGTPVLDIKPYLPFADSHPQASAGWAEGEIKKYHVTYSAKSKKTLEEMRDPQYLKLLHQMLELDPRPTSQRSAHPIEAQSSEGRPYAFRLLNFDIQWEIRDQSIYVVDVINL